jgi:hypothetical protein
MNSLFAYRRGLRIIPHLLPTMIGSIFRSLQNSK